MRCKRSPPHVLNGRIVTHKNQRECDEMGTTNVLQVAAPAPAPTPPPAPAAATPPPTTEAKPKPTLTRRFFKPVPRTPDMAPSQPALQVSEEWEFSDELAERFWTGTVTVLRYLLGMIGGWFDVEKSVIAKYQSSMELNTSDLHMLGRATKDGLTAAFKRMGVKSLERAERIVDSMGGFAVLLAIFLPLFAFVIQEIPRSPRWLAWKKKQAERGKKTDDDRPAMSPSGKPVAAETTGRVVPDWKLGRPKAG